MNREVPTDGQMWATFDDVPWFPATAPTLAGEPFPATGHSDSGITYTVDRDPTGEKWCAACHPQWNAFCFMPMGHDTPHLAASAELVREIGPIVVTSMRRITEVAS